MKKYDKRKLYRIVAFNEADDKVTIFDKNRTKGERFPIMDQTWSHDIEQAKAEFAIRLMNFMSDDIRTGSQKLRVLVFEDGFGESMIGISRKEHLCIIDKGNLEVCTWGGIAFDQEIKINDPIWIMKPKSQEEYNLIDDDKGDKKNDYWQFVGGETYYIKHVDNYISVSNDIGNLPFKITKSLFKEIRDLNEKNILEQAERAKRVKIA